MKIKYSNACSKWSIAFCCALLLGYSVYNDYSYQRKLTEDKSKNSSKDSLLQVSVVLLESLYSDTRVMNESVYKHLVEIDSTLQKHIKIVDNTAKKQNSMLNQISRKLNQ